MIKPRPATQAWHRVLRDCLDHGQRVSPRGLPSREHVGYLSQIDMRYPCVFSRYRKVSPKFACGETAWYMSGSNDLKTMLRYAPSYGRYSDDGLTLNGAYGPMIVDQLPYVAKCLGEDPMSRQAVMTIWRPSPQPSKDIPCTIALQFIVRDGAIHTVATMRSNDAWIGFIYDTFAFTMITAFIGLILRDGYSFPTLHMGTLSLCVGSQHLYEKNTQAANLALVTTDYGAQPALLLGEYSGTVDLINDLDIVANRDPDAPTISSWLGEWRDWHA